MSLIRLSSHGRVSGELDDAAKYIIYTTLPYGHGLSTSTHEGDMVATVHVCHALVMIDAAADAFQSFEKAI